MKRALLLLAACRTVPTPTDAGLLAEPVSVSVSVSVPVPVPVSVPDSGSDSGPVAECVRDADCGPASCCGPFSASDRCGPRTRYPCTGDFDCPMILTDFACVCAEHRCAPKRIRGLSGSATPRSSK